MDSLSRQGETELGSAAVSSTRSNLGALLARRLAGLAGVLHGHSAGLDAFRPSASGVGGIVRGIGRRPGARPGRAPDYLPGSAHPRSSKAGGWEGSWS